MGLFQPYGGTDPQGIDEMTAGGIHLGHHLLIDVLAVVLTTVPGRKGLDVDGGDQEDLFAVET